MEVFGSAIRDDFDPDTSDVDLMVSRPTPQTVRVTLFDEMRMCEELTAIFGRNVDLVWRSVIEEKPHKIRNMSILARTVTIYPTPCGRYVLVALIVRSVLGAVLIHPYLGRVKNLGKRYIILM